MEVEWQSVFVDPGETQASLSTWITPQGHPWLDYVWVDTMLTLSPQPTIATDGTITISETQLQSIGDEGTATSRRLTRMTEVTPRPNLLNPQTAKINVDANLLRLRDAAAEVRVRL